MEKDSSRLETWLLQLTMLFMGLHARVRSDSPQVPFGEASSADADEILEWLTSDECQGLDDAGLVEGLARRLRIAGLGLDCLGLHLHTLHPETVGRSAVWSPDGRVEIQDRAHGFNIADNSTWSLLDRGEWVVVPRDDPRAAAGVLHDLFTRCNLSELVLVPLMGAFEHVGGAGFGTQRAAGFTPDELATVRRIVPALRTACEVRAVRRREANLLDTYVGSLTGQRILAGDIRRAKLESLDAALMLCDMRDFTALSDRLPETRVLELLNIYFDQIVPPIVDAGGEILKFMGDAVLAFFRSEADPAMNCSAAFDAALRGLARLDAVALREPELRAGISLHHGTVSYGNIGAGSRLDFTIIGRDVNLVSRIQTVCSVVGQRLLISAPFAYLLARTDVQSIGLYQLKGFDQPHELFAWIGGKYLSRHSLQES